MKTSLSFLHNTRMLRCFLLLCVISAFGPLRLFGQYSTTDCASCKVWNQPQEPFKVFGNTYYVGTHGLSSILITSPSGHILIDGGLPESAEQIRDHIRALGFGIEDVKLVLNSHVHFDHAGGIAQLQRWSRARVAASPASAPVDKKAASACGVEFSDGGRERSRTSDPYSVNVVLYP